MRLTGSDLREALADCNKPVEMSRVDVVLECIGVTWEQIAFEGRQALDSAEIPTGDLDELAAALAQSMFAAGYLAALSHLIGRHQT